MRMCEDDPECADIRALALISEALDLLDAHGGSPQAAAHIALAQQDLRQAIAKRSKPDG